MVIHAICIIARFRGRYRPNQARAILRRPIPLTRCPVPEQLHAFDGAGADDADFGVDEELGALTGALLRSVYRFNC